MRGVRKILRFTVQAAASISEKETSAVAHTKGNEVYDYVQEILTVIQEVQLVERET